MMTKRASKTLLAASLVLALGATGVAPAMANGVAMQSTTDTSVGTKVSDTWITTKVKSDFATTDGVDVTAVSVDTRNGVVTLSGTVDSQAEKRTAIRAAKSIEGVKAVRADRLMVGSDHSSMSAGSMDHNSMDHDSNSSDTNDSMTSDTSLGTKVSDTWITTKVKSDFATTEGVDMTDISVDTKDGVVTLSGTAGSQAEKRKAIQTAKSIKGVKAVQADRLMVGSGHSSTNSGSMNSKHSDTNDSMPSDTSLGTKVSDTWITTKLKSNFATTEGVDMTDISVDTKDGVVTLSGRAGSQAEKRKAIRTAKSIKGVKAVQADRLMVGSGHSSMSSGSMNSNDSGTNDSMSSDTSLGTKVSDTWITTKVKSDFATTEGVDMTDISVDTKDGVVTLSGTAGSQAEKRKAIQTAKSIKGVKAVQADRLMVGSDHSSMSGGSMNSNHSDTNDSMSSNTSLGTKVSDAWITTKVKSDFATTEGVDMTDISVDTKDGVVTLSGTAGSQAEKRKAIQEAKSIKGVKTVQADRLMVGSDHSSMSGGSMNSNHSDTNDSMSSDTSLGTKVSDAWITTKVKSDFATTEGVDMTDISVDTKDGVVTLSGKVDSQNEKQQAVKAAKSVKGVKAVEADQLTLGND